MSNTAQDRGGGIDVPHSTTVNISGETIHHNDYSGNGICADKLVNGRSAGQSRIIMLKVILCEMRYVNLEMLLLSAPANNPLLNVTSSIAALFPL